jgi:formylglycine-generating enzyme required for sulfatase activity
VLGHTVVWEMEGENSGKLYLLKNDDNIRLVSPTTFISGQLILTPQEILQMYTRGEMPPVRSMVLIPGGEFLAGNPFKDEGSEAEKPVHTVEISPFFISPYPVTNGEYRTFMVAGGYANNELWSAEGRKYREESRTVKPSLWGEARFNDQNQPVIGVSWHEASAYLKWAGLRLPTEHEWEYAARGGLQYKRYPWGDETPMGRAHFGYSRNTGMPIAVDRREFVPNGFGLYQMAGNVSEWVLDWYAEDYYQQLKAAGTAINPKGPIEGKDKILRGGSWHQEAYFLRTACRSFISPDGWNYGLGFRAAMNYKPEEK